jgi:hypothetical protein
MSRDSHRLVQCRHFERYVVRYDLKAFAANGVLNQQIVRERTGRTAVADDATGRRHRIDHDMITHGYAGDVATDFNDFARGFVAERHLSLPRRQPAQRDVQRVRPADAAGPYLHQDIRRSDRRLG